MRDLRRLSSQAGLSRYPVPRGGDLQVLVCVAPPAVVRCTSWPSKSRYFWVSDLSLAIGIWLMPASGDPELL